jgi:hypothetical protein
VILSRPSGQLSSDLTRSRMIDRLKIPAAFKRAASSLLLAGGIVFVFAGLSAALGFGPEGMLASVAVIAALLYAGGVWFGAAPTMLAPVGGESVMVFDRSLRIAAGAAPGTPLLLTFPESLRAEIEMRCRLALQGEHTHFDCEHAGARVSFDISPVHTIAGLVLYGVLITGSGLHAPAARPSQHASPSREALRQDLAVS